MQKIANKPSSRSRPTRRQALTKKRLPDKNKKKTFEARLKNPQTIKNKKNTEKFEGLEKKSTCFEFKKSSKENIGEPAPSKDFTVQKENTKLKSGLQDPIESPEEGIIHAPSSEISKVGSPMKSEGIELRTDMQAMVDKIVKTLSVAEVGSDDARAMMTMSIGGSEVMVRIIKQRGKTKVLFQTEDARVKNLLKTSKGELQNSASKAGVKLDRIEIT